MSHIPRALAPRLGARTVLSITLAAIALSGGIRAVRAAPPPEPKVITIGAKGQLSPVVLHLSKKNHERVIWKNTQQHGYLIEFYKPDPHDANLVHKCLSYIRRSVPGTAPSSAGPEGVHESATVGQTYYYRVIDVETGLEVFQGGDGELHPLPTDPSLVIDG